MQRERMEMILRPLVVIDDDAFEVDYQLQEQYNKPRVRFARYSHGRNATTQFIMEHDTQQHDMPLFLRNTIGHWPLAIDV